MTAFTTPVYYVPATPLGLLPERWRVWHRCTACRAEVRTDELVVHAAAHERATSGGRLSEDDDPPAQPARGDTISMGGDAPSGTDSK